MARNNPPLRVLVWGDIQSHPWQEHERPGRLQDVLDSIHWVYAQAKEKDVNMIVFMGDLFESKRSVRSDVFTKTIYTLNELNADAASRGISLKAIAGNHDLYNGECTLDSVEHWDVCNGSVGISRIGGFPLGFIPYNAVLPDVVSDPYQAFYAEPLLYFAHADLKNIRMSTGFTSKTTTLPDWVFQVDKNRAAHAILNGHYHSPATVYPVSGGLPTWVVGAPMEYSWSDVDSSRVRGCVYLEVDNGLKKVTQKHLENEAAPRFVSDPKNARVNDFIRPTAATTIHCPDTVVHENVKLSSTSPAVFLAEWLEHKGIPEDERELYLDTGRYLFGG